MKEEKISYYQAVMLIWGLFLGSAIAMNPAALSGEDAWYSSLVSIAVGFILAAVTGAISMLHPGKTLVEILVACFGRVAGKLIGVIFLLLSTWLSSVVVLNFSYYSDTTSYPETPLVFIAICYMALIAFVVKIGLEAMGRISEIFVVLMVLISIVTLATLATDFHPEVFLPLFKNGILKPTVDGMKGAMIPYAEIFLVLNILPNLCEPKKTYRAAIVSMLVSGIFLYFFALRNISVLGVDLAARNVYPSAKLFRLTPAIDIIPLLDVNVIISGILKVSVSLYAQICILGDLFGLRQFKVFVLPMAALDVVLSTTLHINIMSMIFSDNNIVPLVYIPILVIMPMVVLAVSLFKKGSAGAQAQQPE